MKRLTGLLDIGAIWSLYLIIVLSMGCGNGSGSGGGAVDPAQDPTLGNAQTQNYGMLMGKVRDAQGNPLGAVLVSTAGRTTRTNENGYFSMGDLQETERLVVSLSKNGYVDGTRIAKVQIGESAFLEAVLSKQEKTVDFQSSMGVTHGETYAGNGASVQIGPDALVDASGNPFIGTATIAVTPFDPTTEKGSSCFPGEFTGVTTTGESVFLESFGFMDVTLTDSQGAPLNLAPGRQAEIVMPLPQNPCHSAPPATIPLWYFDTQDGQWHEEGSADLSGSFYRGTVSHFTAWNYDRPWLTGVMGWVKGMVIDATTGLPVKGAKVFIQGLNWYAEENGVDMEGAFIIPVMANATGTLQASKGTAKSPVQPIYSTNGVLDVGNIYINGTPKIEITLTWGKDPEDLDAHLAIPLAGGWAQLYFGTPGKSIEGATLNTDDMSGEGPEIISVYDLRDGVYRYSVHHYSGSGDLSTSKAAIHMIVNGMGFYSLDPPVGAQGTGDIWRAWDITVSGGKVMNVQVVNDYVKGTSMDDFNP